MTRPMCEPFLHFMVVEHTLIADDSLGMKQAVHYSRTYFKCLNIEEEL